MVKVNPVTIYLDTMVWNELCDQHREPIAFKRALTSQPCAGLQ